MKKVFDFANESHLETFLIAFSPLFLVVFCIFIFLYVKNKTQENPKENKREIKMVNALFGILFCGGISILTIPSCFKTYFNTKKIYTEKNYLIIEGNVENFKPMPASGHQDEEFDISDIHFNFSDFDVTDFGYNNAASKGGVIKENLHVRIGYFYNGEKNVILILEID